MDNIQVNNLISFVVTALKSPKDQALFAAKGLDCPQEVKDHIIQIILNNN